MRYLFFSLLLLLSTAAFTQQQKESFFLFNKDWSDAKDMESATYFMQLITENDSSYICRYYQKNGPMVRQESYSDNDLTIPNGRFAWYNEKGEADSIGWVWRGKKDYFWNYFGDSGKVVLSKKYDKGKWLYTEDLIQKKRQLANGTIESIGESDTTGHIPADFPGGIKGWRKYLERSLNVPDRFINLNRITGITRANVFVVFDVDKEGAIHIDYIANSCEYSVDNEALRIIKAGPKWTPASINGKKVVYKQKQGIYFVLQ